MPVAQGDLRRRPGDFQVDEELGFEPDGEGEHRFLLIEKENANTAWVARRLAAFAGVPARDVGFSGLKDRHALARQWFSVQLPLRAVVDWAMFREPGVRIVASTANRRKLRRGSHRGNRFHIVLRDLAGDREVVAERLTLIGTQGVPNYFGEQRFGRDAGNLALAASLVEGRRLSRGRRSLALSAARAWLFNQVLDHRVDDGSWRSLLPGDCAGLDGSGSVFAVGEPDDGLLRRAAGLDIHPTGPLWGRGDPGTSGDVEALERAVVQRFEALAGMLERYGLRSERRPLRLAVRDLDWNLEGGALAVSFRLARGAFATAVLRELAHYHDTARLSPHR